MGCAMLWLAVTVRLVGPYGTGILARIFVIGDFLIMMLPIVQVALLIYMIC